MKHRPLPTLAVLAILATLTLIAALLTGCRAETPVAPTTIIYSDTPAPQWTPSTPTIPADTTIAWAYIDSTEGTQLRGGDQALHSLDQLIIPGVAADYTNTLDQADVTPSPRDVAALHGALTGDPTETAALTRLAGDADTVFPRIADACALTDTHTDPPRATAVDTARYAACLREGAIAEPVSSRWILDQMRGNPGGIGDVRGNDGTRRLAQFNSTQPASTDRTRTGCLAVGAYWSAAVFVDHPTGRGAMFGVAVCAEVAAAEFPPDTQKAPGLDGPAPSATT